jgi:hypothetical protein
VLERSVEIAAGTGNMLMLGIALHAVAATSAADEPRSAARLWGAALELAPLWPLFTRRYGELLEPARAELGDELDELVAAGSQLSVDDAVALSQEPVEKSSPTEDKSPTLALVRMRMRLLLAVDG